jgi:pimeloyl-ACP methyl ester carboxylesterase
MADLFSAYEVQGAKIPAYFIESTAPNNIDDHATYQTVPHNTVQIGADVAIDRIVQHLKSLKNPNLVISVHGFNSQRDDILKGYGRSFESVNNDHNLNNREVVCIGYRWPSEHMGAPICTTLRAAPWFLRGLLFFGVISTIWALWEYLKRGEHEILIGGFGVFSLAISFMLIILRIIVYFRDGYRATSFGVPDLVEIIRQIDKKLEAADGRRNFVNLSFIGHSMGGYVVTNVVRILSDVFSPDSIRPSINMGTSSADEATVSPNIGKVFRLMRLVLVSPDIPAEALISSRANFLASSLHRFQEAFLFSNEGDEVLRQISTTANYFSFPTRSRTFGYRLGNVVLRENYGVATGVDLHNLRIGYMRLDQLYDTLDKLGWGPLDRGLPKQFSYFDCTDGVDEPEPGAGVRGMLTLAKFGHRNKLRWYNHFWLLVRYIFWHQNPNVHGGYFDAPFLRHLMYRLVCIGRDDTLQAYNGQAGLDKECQEHQISVLLR